MNLKQIEYVIEISRTKSFTNAATNLYITQPTLSAQIKALEEELQVELFKRHKKSKVELTDAGKTFLLYAEQVHADMNKLNLAMGELTSNERGEIRIGLLWTFGYTKIPKMIDEFRQNYPHIKLTFKIDGSEILIQDLIRHKLDAIFILDDNLNSYHHLLEKQNRYLISESNLTAVMNKNHPLAAKNHLEFNQLADASILMVSQKSAMHQDLLEKLGKNHQHIIGESSQADIILQIAENNIGIGFLAEETFHHCHSEKAVSVPLYPPIKRSIFYVCNPESDNSKWSILFRQFVLDRIQL